MSWTDSRVFAAWVFNPMLSITASLPTGYTGLINDTVKAALFNATGTPDRTAGVGNTGYNTGQWVTANEVTGASEWVAGGRALSSDVVVNGGAGVITYQAANLTGSATVTMSNIYGCLVYDASITGGTVANQGLCYNYFGGAQSVASGTFSINWNAAGIATFTT